MKYYAVKNWNEFQHYAKRSPPWIKLHRSLVDDYHFCSLSDAAKCHLIMLWLCASQNDGRIPADAPFLERKLSISGLELDIFVELGFLIDT